MISRRAFLAGSAALALVTACGDDGGGATPAEDLPIDDGPLIPTVFGAGFADGYAASSALVAGIAQRAPFVAMTDIGRIVRGEEAPPSVDVEILHNGTAIASLTVDRHDNGIPTPYYPVKFTPPEPGEYAVRASFAEKATPFKVAAPGDLTLLQAGEQMRPLDTPTTDDARGVKPICTLAEPCPFHSITLTEALTMAKPVVLIVATPGFCQTAICGPVLELLIESADAHPDVTIVHAEVYRDPESGKLETADVVSTYGLTYEPSFFAADANGTLKTRLDFSWDRTELEAAFASIQP